jgi:hypothetical protein
MRIELFTIEIAWLALAVFGIWMDLPVAVWSHAKDLDQDASSMSIESPANDSLLHGRPPP